MLIATALGFLKLLEIPFVNYLTTSVMFCVSACLGFFFSKRYKSAVFRDICFIGFFWVWLSVMFEYWFFTYLYNYSPDFILRNNILFSSLSQVTIYFILFFSPIYFFKKNQQLKVVDEK